jgi:multiple sugar transport system substrate-binding protein
LTLCWAAWDPANALRELSKDFTAESGVKMNFEFVPWTNFADRFLNELNSRGKLCDLMIGDSQWLGTAATEGHYVKLNDFFDKEGIDINSFLPATVYAYSTWPKGSPNYWALPAMGDALGWIYRKDWFSKPELQAEFKQKNGYDLGVPKNWDQLMDIGKFFQGREIDGKKRYGLAIYTERGSEGITMGVTAAMYAWGMRYDDPKNPYHMEGFLNSADTVAALEFYKELYDCCTPPGHSDAYMVANLDAYKSGQVAIQMNWFAFMPGIYKDEDVGGEKSGFFVNPAQKVEASTLGGQGISVVSYSDKRDLALQYIKWFAQDEVQKKWWSLGGYSASRAVLDDPNFPNTAPFAADFLKAMNGVKDFWQEPAYADLLLSMQKRVHDYVVAGKGTAKEALDKLIKDWTETFEEEGLL